VLPPESNHVTESATGGLGSFLGCLPGINLFFGLEVQMSADLAIEIALATAPR